MTKKILALGASNSRNSINKQLANFAATQVNNAEVNLLDLNDFEMPIYGIDKENESGIPQLAHDFKQQIIDADAIIMACSLNDTSRHMINADIMPSLKKDVVIINGARGPLVEQSSLLAFLKTNELAYAYLDVFEKEPFDSADFENMANVGLTSHIAGVHECLDDGILNFVAEKIRSL